VTFIGSQLIGIQLELAFLYLELTLELVSVTTAVLFSASWYFFLRQHDNWRTAALSLMKVCTHT